MPVIKPEDLDNYKPQSDFDFLQLKEDGDVVKVRFYIESMDDLKFYVVHQITDKTGRTRYVNCLRTYDQPIDDCPFCVEALNNKDLKIQTKMFLYVLDMDDSKVKLFERGRQFYKEIEGHIRRNSPLVSYPCEIERNGAKGSTDTVYKVFPLASEKDETLIKDLPETPELLGGYVLDLSYEQAEQFLKTGLLPGSENTEESSTLRRRTSRNTTEQPQQVERTTRRQSSRF